VRLDDIYLGFWLMDLLGFCIEIELEEGEREKRQRRFL